MMNLTAWCLRSCLLRFHQTWGGPRMDIKILNDLFQVTIGETCATVTTRLFRRGLWSILVFSRVEKWSCGSRSIGETWGNALESDARSWPSSWRTLLDGNAHSSRYGEMIHDGSGKPETVHHQEQAYSSNFVMGSEEWKSEVTAHDRSGKLDKTSWNAVQQVRPHREEPLLDGGAQSVRYGGRLHDGSGQPDSADSQEVAYSENFVMGDSETFVMGSDAAEFANKVKDQVRKRQKRMSNVAESGEEHSIIWGMFMARTMDAATFMGKNFLDIKNSIMNSTDLTLKQMFDISAKLVGEQAEIFDVDKIHWEKHSLKHPSLIGDETVIKLQRPKVYVFSINMRSPKKLGRTG